MSYWAKTTKKTKEQSTCAAVSVFVTHLNQTLTTIALWAILILLIWGAAQARKMYEREIEDRHLIQDVSKAIKWFNQIQENPFGYLVGDNLGRFLRFCCFFA